MSKLTYEDITTISGMTYRTVKRKLDNDGVVFCKKKGRSLLFDSVEVMECLFGGGSSESEDESPTQLLERERLREKKRQNDIEEQKVAPVHTLTIAIEKLASQILPILDALPLEMKRMNPNLTGHDIQLVKKSIAKCRNLIAGLEINLDD